MATLRVERRLPLKPYTPKPGSFMDTHATVTLKRDSDRKVITLTYGTIQVNGNMVGYSLSSPSKRYVLAESRTHAPKVFDFERGIINSNIDAKAGVHWDNLVAMLAEHGLELA